MNEFAERLKTARENAGLSQRALSAVLKIQQPSYSRYETQDEKRFVYPGAEMMIQICKALACSADWLLGLKNDMPSIAVGQGSAIAIGGNASVVNGASEPAASESACCRKCPYRKKVEKLEKMLLK